MSRPLYRTFNNYLRGEFGERVQRLSLDAGFGCPNLDGTLSNEGCIYCQNNAFAPNADTSLSLEEQIISSIAFYQKRSKVKRFIAYFQAYCSTHASCDKLDQALSVVRKFKEIVGISISTRPDSIDRNRLSVISQYKDGYLLWIELGLQTTSPEGLDFLRRRHTFGDFERALSVIRSYDINTSVHMILGLPDYGAEGALSDFKKLSSLDIQGVKFHLLHVLKDTLLAKRYAQGEITLMNRAEYISCVCDCLEVLRSDIVIMRLVSSAQREFLIAPSWMNERFGIREEIELEFIRRGTYQGSNYESAVGTSSPGHSNGRK